MIHDITVSLIDAKGEEAPKVKKIIKTIFESKTEDGKFYYNKEIWMREYLIKSKCSFCKKTGRVFFREVWEGFAGRSNTYHKKCLNKFQREIQKKFRIRDKSR